MRLLYIISFAAFLMLCIACKERPHFSKKINIKGNWNYENQLVFPIEIDQLDDTYDLILALTYGTNFGYQNIYVKIITQYPSGKKNEDIISLNLTNGSGLFLGNCNSSKCAIDLLLQEKFNFNEKGTHTITLIQNGRVDNLESVFAAELKLYKLKK